MEYVSVSEAKKTPGLRLVLTANIPGPYGEAAKAVLKLRGVDFIPVEQRVMEPNEELREWTGVRNAPVAVLDDEPPLTTWHEILLLGERLGSGPSLLPSDPVERALTLGFSLEICGRDGVGWCTRVILQSPESQKKAPTPAPQTEEIRRAYGIRAEAISSAPDRVRSILGGLAAQLRRQRSVGSPYLVGAQLSAADIYWAFFSLPLAPMAKEDNPVPDWLLARHRGLPQSVTGAVDPDLIRHRDMVLRDHVGLPLDY
jgi:glutathione S-transferase